MGTHPTSTRVVHRGPHRRRAVHRSDNGPLSRTSSRRMCTAPSGRPSKGYRVHRGSEASAVYVMTNEDATLIALAARRADAVRVPADAPSIPVAECVSKFPKRDCLLSAFSQFSSSPSPARRAVYKTAPHGKAAVRAGVRALSHTPSRPGRDGGRLRGGMRAAPGLRPLTCAVISVGCPVSLHVCCSSRAAADCWAQTVRSGADGPSARRLERGRASS